MTETNPASPHLDLPTAEEATAVIDRLKATWGQQNCCCQYRPGAVCLNAADSEDGLCSPCRVDGGDGHPHTHEHPSGEAGDDCERCDGVIGGEGTTGCGCTEKCNRCGTTVGVITFCECDPCGPGRLCPACVERHRQEIAADATKSRRVVVGRHGEDDLLFTLMAHPTSGDEVLRVEHQCTRAAFWPAAVVYLPLSGPESWTVVSRDPLTITPSIQCFSCKLHGFITDGEWRAC